VEILHSKIYGEDKLGTPILVFHGLFGMLDNWGNFGKKFSEYMPVHLIDLRNHGRSFHSDEISLEVMSKDIDSYLNHHNLDKVNLLGHSLGGKVVMEYAISNPVRIDKLIVADISPKAYPPHHEVIFQALQSVNLSYVSGRKDAENQIKKYISDIDVIQFLLKNLYWEEINNEKKKLSWRFNLSVLNENYKYFVTKAVKTGTFNGKTLFLSGEKSNYITQDDEALISQKFPNYILKKIPKAGHWLHAENPTDFNYEIEKFLIDHV